MKNLKCISYIMISLILLQSFSAVANSLDFHAIDTQHMQHEHQHLEHSQAPNDIPTKVLGESGTADYHNPADCHHCGHCHGTHAQWLSQHNINNLQSVVLIHNFNYLDAIIDAPNNRLLRPPKATS